MIYDHFVVFPAFPSLQVWPWSFPFSRLYPFSEFCLKTLPTSSRLRWLLWGFDLFSVLVQQRFCIQELPHPEQVTPLRFVHRFGAFPRAGTLRPYFMPQRSWDLPYRAFPSLNGRSSLEQRHPLVTLAPNSDLTVKQSLLETRYSEFCPPKNPYCFLLMLLKRNSRCSFGFSPSEVCPIRKME